MNRRRWLTVLVGVLLALGAEARPRRQSIVRYDLSPLVAMANGKLKLIGGRSITLPGLWSQRRIFFDDLQPGANWRHPARIRVEMPDGRLESEMQVDFPPVDLDSCPVVSGTPPKPKTKVEFKVQPLKGAHKVTDPDKYWAFLLNGHAEQRHWNDFSYLYRVLTQVYGYLPSHIVVADSVFKTRLPDLDENGSPDIEFGSTFDEVKRAFTHLGGRLKKTDRLLFVVNDHGATLDGESTLVLFDSEVKASVFLPLLNALPNDEIISVYEQCNAGGFVRGSVTATGRVAVAASTNLEQSWATTDFQFDEFLYHFISAVGYQRHDGTLVRADADGDGKVSIKEAYLYAAQMDRAPESPFLESFTTTGKAMDIGVGH